MYGTGTYPNYVDFCAIQGDYYHPRRFTDADHKTLYGALIREVISTFPYDKERDFDLSARPINVGAVESYPYFLLSIRQEESTGETDISEELRFACGCLPPNYPTQLIGKRRFDPTGQSILTVDYFCTSLLEETNSEDEFTDLSDFFYGYETTEEEYSTYESDKLENVPIIRRPVIDYCFGSITVALDIFRVFRFDDHETFPRPAKASTDAIIPHFIAAYQDALTSLPGHEHEVYSFESRI